MTDLKIDNNFKRLSPGKLEELRNLEPAHIDDILGRNRAIGSEFKPFNDKRLAGTAFTVKTSAGDNLYIYAAYNFVKEGDILVVDAEGYTDRAVMGEILIKFCEAKKLAGVIVNGSIRDVEALKDVDIPIYATGTSPNGPYKNGPGALNVPVTLGNIAINPGDILIGDADGVVVLREDELDYAISETYKLIEKEKEILANYDKGIFPNTSFAIEKIKNQ